MPVHSQAPTSFFSISLYLCNSYILSRFFLADILLIHLYLSPDFPLLSWYLLIGAFFISFSLLDLQINLLILSILASPFLANFLAVPPILGLSVGSFVISGLYTFGLPDFSSSCWPNTPSFFPMSI